MIGLIVKNGTKVVKKDLYAGGESDCLALIDYDMAKHKGLVTEIHRDTDADWKTAFEEVVVAPVLTKDQEDWQAEKAKGPEAALHFIAKKLGLE